MDRRAFFRYGLLAGAAALTASALMRRGSATCTTAQGICTACPGLPECELPQALSARQAGAAPGTPADAGGSYTLVRRIPGGKEPARAVEFGPDGRLWLAAGNTLALLSETGTREREILFPAPVRCIAVAGDGTLYAGLRDQIVVCGADGRQRASWKIPGSRPWLTGLAVGADTLFAADAGNRVLHRFDRSGRVLGQIGVKDPERDIPGFVIPSPYFTVRLHPDGLLRVNNPGRHRVEAYTTEGDFEGAWGTASAAPAGFCGCCNPVGLALLPDGRIVTCEKGLPRVKIFSSDGVFESVAAPSAAFPEAARAGAGSADLDTSLAGLAASTDAHGRIAVLDHVTGSIHLLQPKA
jgi:hypothetical protein